MRPSRFLSMSDAERRAFVLDGGTYATIAYLAAPAMLMGAVQALIPFVDALFVYNAAGAGTGASVSFVAPIVNTASAFGAGLGVAGVAVIGQANGAGNERAAAELRRQFLFTVLASGAVACAAIWLFGARLLAPLPEELRSDAGIYLSLTAAGIPLTYFTFAYNALASAKGRTERPFYRVLLVFVSKAALNAVFVWALGLGALGAGIAGLGANAAAALWMARELLAERRKGPVLPPFAVDRGTVLRFLALGVPSALTQASNTISFYIMNGQAAGFGSAVLNGFGIANMTNSVFFAPASAIGSAVAASVSMAGGAGRYGRSADVARAGLALGAASSVLFALVLLPAAPALVSLFSRDPEVLRHASDAMRVFSVSIIGFAVFNIVSSAFAGTGRADVQLLIAVLRVWVIRVPATFAIELCFPGIGAYAVWIPMALSNFGTAAAALLLFRRIDWAHRAVEPKVDKEKQWRPSS
jgi:putative MATE family efflux protein